MKTIIILFVGVATLAACKKSEEPKPEPKSDSKPATKNTEPIVAPKPPDPAPAPPTASASGPCKGYEHKDPHFCIDLPSGFSAFKGTPPEPDTMPMFGPDGAAFSLKWFDVPAIDSQINNDGAPDDAKKTPLSGNRGIAVTYPSDDKPKEVAAVYINGGDAKPNKFNLKVRVIICRHTGDPKDATHLAIKASCESIRML